MTLWLPLCPVNADDAQTAGEKFVPGSGRSFAAATLELRPEVSLIGAEVRLKNVCRWADSDKAAFEPVAELVLFRLKQTAPYRTITIDELRQTLTEAGMNLAVIRFAGATACTVARTDVKFDERNALEQWIAARETPATRPTLIDSPATQPSAGAATAPANPAPANPVAVRVPAANPPVAVREEPKANKSLRDYLLAELSERLSIPVDQIQYYFSPSDDKLLNLAEPLFKFSIKPPRNRNLGEVTWELTIQSGDANQKAQVTGTVKAWQMQVLAARPMAYRQVITEPDLIERRTLVDRLPEDPLVTIAQCVGQMSARELKPGTLMTARLIEATVLVKSGQLVTILMTQGSIQAKTVAKAMEQGTMGQTIRVKNEVTGNVFDVVVTGPQTAMLPSVSMPSDVARVDR